MEEDMTPQEKQTFKKIIDEQIQNLST